MKYLDEQDVYLINGDEMRKILHALWMAKAMRAHTEKLFYFNIGMDTTSEKWAWVERKCREKAKEFQ